MAITFLPLDAMMRLSIVQSSLHWEHPEANRVMFAEKMRPLAGHTDLVVLPEMFTTGFSMNAAQLAEPMQGPTTAWMLEQAAALGAAVAGSFICSEEGRYFNRFVFARPDGSVETYNKRHLFSLAGEDKTYAQGWDKARIEWLGWRIRPLICYDLRFPVWSRNEKNNPYDLLLYVANWPQTRIHHWSSLLVARAIENQCYVVAPAQAGIHRSHNKDSQRETYGHTMVVDPWGSVMASLASGVGIIYAEINTDFRKDVQKQIPMFEHRRL